MADVGSIWCNLLLQCPYDLCIRKRVGTCERVPKAPYHCRTNHGHVLQGLVHGIAANVLEGPVSLSQNAGPVKQEYVSLYHSSSTGRTEKHKTNLGSFPMDYELELRSEVNFRRTTQWNLYE